MRCTPAQLSPDEHRPYAAGCGLWVSASGVARCGPAEGTSNLWNLKLGAATMTGPETRSPFMMMSFHSGGAGARPRQTDCRQRLVPAGCGMCRSRSQRRSRRSWSGRRSIARTRADPVASGAVSARPWSSPIARMARSVFSQPSNRCIFPRVVVMAEAGAKGSLALPGRRPAKQGFQSIRR